MDCLAVPVKVTSAIVLASLHTSLASSLIDSSTLHPSATYCCTFCCSEARRDYSMSKPALCHCRPLPSRPAISPTMFGLILSCRSVLHWRQLPFKLFPLMGIPQHSIENICC